MGGGLRGHGGGAPLNNSAPLGGGGGGGGIPHVPSPSPSPVPQFHGSGAQSHGPPCNNLPPPDNTPPVEVARSTGRASLRSLKTNEGGAETQRGRLWTACGQRCVDSKNSQNDPGNNQHILQYANYWAPLTHKRHIPPHSAQPRHTNHWAPRTQKRHQQGAPAAAADRTQRPDATCGGKSG